MSSLSTDTKIKVSPSEELEVLPVLQEVAQATADVEPSTLVKRGVDGQVIVGGKAWLQYSSKENAVVMMVDDDG